MKVSNSSSVVKLVYDELRTPIIRRRRAIIMPATGFKYYYYSLHIFFKEVS